MELHGTDYTKRNKDVLVITVGTAGKEEKLSVMMPTKGIYDELVKVAEVVDKAAQGEIDEGYSLFDHLPAVAEAMSNNREGRVITPQQLDEWGFDMSDVADFIGLYIYFIGKVVEAKNSRCPKTPTRKGKSGSTGMLLGRHLKN